MATSPPFPRRAVFLMKPEKKTDPGSDKKQLAQVTFGKAFRH